MHVRVKVHVFNVGEFGDPETGPALIQAHLNKTRDYFQPYGIELDFATPHQILDASSYDRIESENEIAQMKAAFAESPATQINVYVTNYYFQEGQEQWKPFGGRGYYP